MDPDHKKYRQGDTLDYILSNISLILIFYQKALPWYTQVRKLLQDQSYWGWFIPYEGCRTATGEYTCKNKVTGAIDATANL